MFKSCLTKNGIIHLIRSRCLTITHTCSFDCKGNDQAVFLYYKCVQEDFSICLYSTFVQTKTDNGNSVYNFKCTDGSQYYRCNNMTNCKSCAYQFDAPYCFSFSMMTVVDCEGTCLQLSGYTTKQCEKAFNKTIENVNLFSNSNNDGYILRIAGECHYKITFINSVLLCKDNKKLVTWTDGRTMTVVFINCIINRDLGAAGKVTFIDPTQVDFSTNYLTILPHYTTHLCPGPQLNDPPSALGCNAGNCLDNVCNRSIEFPENVVPYTTILHLDINTPTPSPSNGFSESDMFSQSQKFTSSGVFSISNSFHPTSKFTGSKSFTPSTKFSKSIIFTQSDKFTFSSRFSVSNQFTKSLTFSASIKFTQSKSFTHSDLFSKSSCFTDSTKFTSSNKFTPSNHFDASDTFTPSNSFTPSDYFIPSEYFTRSYKFTSSNAFTGSYNFTSSDALTGSYKFTSSNVFSRSYKFTSSDVFTGSHKFTSSDIFTGSNEFTSSDSFTESNELTMFSIFSDSRQFSSSAVVGEGNIGVGDRSSNTTKIGIIAGVSAAAAVAIIAVIAFFIIRHRKMMIPTSDINIMETNVNSITVENDLENLMDEDDPFKNDF